MIVPKTLAENQKSYEKRRLEEGWRRMTVWVPPHLIAVAEKLIQELRDLAKRPACDDAPRGLPEKAPPRKTRRRN